MSDINGFNIGRPVGMSSSIRIDGHQLTDALEVEYVSETAHALRQLHKKGSDKAGEFINVVLQQCWHRIIYNNNGQPIRTEKQWRDVPIERADA